jgi:hypothetical protein
MADGGSRGSNGSRRLQAFVAILGVVLPFGPTLIGGCGSSSAAPAPAAPGPTVTSDAAVPQVTVITYGGGGGSSGAMISNPFGGSSSGSSSSGSGTIDSGADDGPDDDGATDGGVPEGSVVAKCDDTYLPPQCGDTAADTCDLRSNTCCVNLSLVARCIPGANADCAKNEATIHCTQACECGGGDSVCCGVENQILGVVTTQCQTVVDGGLCNPHPQTATQASAQLCKDSSECKNGKGCILQSCEFNAVLSVCGLQSQDPFDCKIP